MEGTHAAYALLLIEPVWNRNDHYFYQEVLRYILLIEPVWNRNCRAITLNIYCLKLLIEPVWNRNVLKRHFDASHNRLLIEPVWNRNSKRYVVLKYFYRPFNRTSLESKRYPRRVYRNDSGVLLIEPVWNRNRSLTERVKSRLNF